MKKYYYDFEVYSNWWCCGVLSEDGEYQCFETLEDLESWDVQTPDKVMIGFNNSRYDNYIWLGMLNKYSAWDMNTAIIKDNVSVLRLMQMTNYTQLGSMTYDILNDIKTKSLKEIELNLGNEVKEEHFTDELDLTRKQEIIDYNKWDCQQTKEAFEAINKETSCFDIHNEIIKVFNLDPVEWMHKTNAKILDYGLHATKLLAQEDVYEFNNELMQQLTDDYPIVYGWLSQVRNSTTGTLGIFKLHGIDCTVACGGLHGALKCYIETKEDWSIFDIDGTSFYPLIMILYNAQSRTVKDSSKIEFLRNLRIEAKKAHNKIRADALKVLINSIYGMSGDKYKKFYDWIKCREVCYIGQCLIISIVQALEHQDFNFHLLQVNTDGLTIYCETKYRDLIVDVLEDNYLLTGMEWELLTTTGIWIMKDVNNFMWRIDTCNEDASKEGYKIKGSFGPLESSWEKQYGCIINKAVFNYIFHNIPVNLTIEHEQCLAEFGFVFNIRSDNYEDMYWGEEPIHNKHNRMFVIEDDLIPEFNRTITKLKGATKEEFMKDAKNQMLYNKSIKDLKTDDLPQLNKNWYILKAEKIIKAITKWKRL